MDDCLITIGVCSELLIWLASFAMPFIVHKSKSERFKKVSTAVFGLAIILGLVVALLVEHFGSYREGDWFGSFMYYMFILPVEIFALISCTITTFLKRNGLYFLLSIPAIFVVLYFVMLML